MRQVSRGAGDAGPVKVAGCKALGAHGHDERHDADHEVFQFLFENHSKIRCRVNGLPDGVETITETDDARIAAKIKDHVEWMTYRIKGTRPIRMRDPLLAEQFRHTGLNFHALDSLRMHRRVRFRRFPLPPFP